MKSKNTYFYRLISSQFRRFFSLAVSVSVLILFPFVTHGAEITLAWDANTEPDLAGYNIYFGTASRNYSEPINVGDVTEVTLTGFNDGGTYYFAATAYDEDDNESAYSEELVHTFSNGKPINNNPTTPSVPGGPSSGYTQTNYTFNTTASDPDGDALQYRFDWGDGVISSWGAASQSHSWSSSSNICVKAQAKDSKGAFSDWSVCKSITITQQAGSLKVSLSPSTAVSAGAQWRVDGGGWRNSGYTQSGLSVGSHTVEFKAVSGWTKPGNKTVTINNNQTTNASGTYTQQTGSLKVTIGPSTAVSAGAKWRVDGGSWRNSGYTESGLWVGSHTVEFKAAAGWSKPGNKTVTINYNQTTNAGGTYSPDNTLPTLTIEAEDMPIKTTGVPITGGWNIWGNGYIADDIDFATGGTVSFEVLAMGSYAGGAWPIMEVRIDQIPMGTITVDSSSWTTYTIQASITSGTHEVAIAFINDYFNPPDDRNLYVDKVTITTENSAPVSNAGNDQTVQEGEIVTLSGLNSSDPDDNIDSYFWQQTGEKSVVLSNSKGSETTFTAPNAVTDADTLTFSLTVIDTEGLEDIDYCIVTVTKKAVVDSDGDGVPDGRDAFPDDPEESLDSDGDGVGNNADTDDDDDGMPDTWESKYGLNPLEDDAADDPDGDGVSNYDEYYYFGSNPNLNEDNFEPYPPALIAPEDHEVSLTPLLETEEFDDPNYNDVHSQTQWEITDEDGYIVFDVTTDSSLTSLTVPKMILDYDTKYIWRVKFIDNYGGASDWSEDGFFTTEFSQQDSDGNGILDHQEVGDTLDLDNDGVPDREQPDIKCIVANSGNAQIGVSIRDAQNVDSILSLEIEESENADLVSNSKGKPRFIDFGLLHFKLLLNAPGEETVVTIHLSDVPFGKGQRNKRENIKTFKYDPVNAEWLDYSQYAEFSSDRKKVYLTLKDGGFGDADGIENGIIVDPLAFGSDSDSNSNSGSGSDSDDSLIPKNLSCFITTASADAGNIQPLCNWREIGTRELLIVIILMMLGYVGTDIFSKFRQKREDEVKPIGLIAM
jgi:hypothetical protein